MVNITKECIHTMYHQHKSLSCQTRILIGFCLKQLAKIKLRIASLLQTTLIRLFRSRIKSRTTSAHLLLIHKQYRNEAKSLLLNGRKEWKIWTQIAISNFSNKTLLRNHRKSGRMLARIKLKLNNKSKKWIITQWS